ncbi:hypothetical protein RhiirA1_538010 [Rhizophagus irregularis]|uniref:Uncharacterized protein n=1 Tax=Rhizophagus irregularis TaxID=588596 RepID=A0A2N0RIG6_9GLOM|nr:hypothetical protein RhiirA1_538010 [Rhizophagus irregularis]
MIGKNITKTLCLIQRSEWNLLMILEVPDRTYQRYWNSEVPDRTYQRYWNSEVPDRTYQRYWNSENLSKILEFGGSSVLDFGDEGFFSSWNLETTGGVLRLLDFEDDRYRRPLLWIGIGETLSHPSLWIGFSKILHFGSSIGCDLWILGIDWHRLGPLDRYRLRPLETCGIKLGPLETKPVVYGFLVLSELNFKGLQVPGRFLNVNLNSCLLESN